MRKSLWSPDEDEKLRQYVATHGCGNWSNVAKHTGLRRCGKSCRLRWINYLRPDLRKGPFTAHEVRIVVNLHRNLGNSWSKIASHLPGRTDNDVKNFWHSYTRTRRLVQQPHQQQTNVSAGPCEYKDMYNTNVEEKPRYSDVRPMEKAKEVGISTHQRDLIQPPPLIFPPIANINGVGAHCRAPSINVHSSPSLLHFNVATHNQLLGPNVTCNTSIARTSNPDRFQHLPIHLYPKAHLPPFTLPDATANVNLSTNDDLEPAMLHAHLDDDDDDAEFGALAVCKGMQCHVTDDQIVKSKEPYATITSLAASSNATSTSYCTTSSMNSHLQINSQQADDWSLLVSPSMQISYTTNSHTDAGAGFDDQAGYGIADGRPQLEGLQSMLWRLLDHQGVAAAAPYDISAAAASAGPADRDSHDHHSQYEHHQHKPADIILPNSLPPNPAPFTSTHTPNQLASDQLVMDVEAFSASANLAQYLQARLAADCFS